jgi:hypothetical protein
MSAQGPSCWFEKGEEVYVIFAIAIKTGGCCGNLWPRELCYSIEQMCRVVDIWTFSLAAAIVDGPIWMYVIGSAS